MKTLCNEVRKDIVKMTTVAGSGHPGGSLSSVEMLVALYNTQMNVDPADPHNPDRDRFVLSKGHVAPVYYSVLAHKGFFPVEELWTLRRMHSRLQGHPDSKKLPGVDVSSGSLGQGVSLAVGMALGAKYQNKSFHVYTLLGDGELGEGQVWEAFMAAAHYRLDNLTIMVDWNGMQIDGTNDQVMSLGDLSGKLRAFGLNLIEVQDGNDVAQVIEALNAPAVSGKPKCILCHTVKGKGVSFMENQVGWHGKAPNKDQCEQALQELEA